MRLIDIVNAPWAITPEMHSEVQAIYARHMRGDKINVADIEAATGKQLGGATSGYDVVNGVAVLPLDGVLAKRMNLFMQISGGTSMQIAANSFRAALADPDVTAIVLEIDSPGGTVDGTQELADLIYNARGVKPVVALADGMMASAAYWIGSAAAQVYMSSDTDVIGSIGVVQAHVDISKAEDSRGVKTTEITAGKFKRIASQYGPLSPEGRATLQDQVDQIYGVFVDTVARNRGVSAEQVVQDMADGRVFIGQQAVNAGLVDGVSTLDALIAKAAGGGFDNLVDDGASAHSTVADQSAGDAPATAEAINTEAPMDIEKLKAEHPDVAAALIDEGFKAGADAERTRIQDVEAQAMAGHETLIAALKFDGKTTGPEAAVQVLQAEKAKKNQRVADLNADAADATVTHAAAPDKEAVADGDKNVNPHQIAKQAQKYQAKQADKGVKVSAAEAVAYVMSEKENDNG